jgi:hypothetical protein
LLKHGNDVLTAWYKGVQARDTAGPTVRQKDVARLRKVDNVVRAMKKAKDALVPP